MDIESASGPTLKPIKCRTILTSCEANDGIHWWDSFQVANSGKHLGFFLGPHCGVKQWLGLLQKNKDRVDGTHINK